jgi:hypothetical protein
MRRSHALPIIAAAFLRQYRYDQHSRAAQFAIIVGAAVALRAA